MSLVNAYKNWQQLCRPSFLRPLAVPTRPLAVPTRELTGVDKTCSQEGSGECSFAWTWTSLSFRLMWKRARLNVGDTRKDYPESFSVHFDLLFLKGLDVKGRKFWHMWPVSSPCLCLLCLWFWPNGESGNWPQLLWFGARIGLWAWEMTIDNSDQ